MDDIHVPQKSFLLYGLFNNAKRYLKQLTSIKGFHGGSVVKNLPANAGDTGDVGSILESRCPGGGNGNALQYFPHLGNLVDRGAWWTTVHEVAKEVDRT